MIFPQATNICFVFWFFFKVYIYIDLCFILFSNAVRQQLRKRHQQVPVLFGYAEWMSPGIWCSTECLNLGIIPMLLFPFSCLHDLNNSLTAGHAWTLMNVLDLNHLHFSIKTLNQDRAIEYKLLWLCPFLPVSISFPQFGCSLVACFCTVWTAF